MSVHKITYGRRIQGAGLVKPELPTKKDKWKGSNILSVRYFLMAILGKKRSGKSTLIYNLVRKFTTKNTIVLMFINTYHKDPTYALIREYLDEKGIPYLGYTSILSDDGQVNEIEEFMRVNRGGDEVVEEDLPESEAAVEETPPPKVGVLFRDEPVEENLPKKRKKKLKPEYLIIIDDNNTELKDGTLAKLCKQVFHFKAKVIISTQGVVDINRQIYGQMDYVAVFRNFNQQSIEALYERIQPSIPLGEFWELYRSTTDEGVKQKDDTIHYDFLLIDRGKEQYRRNLNLILNN